MLNNGKQIIISQRIQPVTFVNRPTGNALELEQQQCSKPKKHPLDEKYENAKTIFKSRIEIFSPFSQESRITPLILYLCICPNNFTPPSISDIQWKEILTRLKWMHTICVVSSNWFSSFRWRLHHDRPRRNKWFTSVAVSNRSHLMLYLCRLWHRKWHQTKRSDPLP